MTPAEVAAMPIPELEAFVAYQRREYQQQQKAAQRARSRRHR